MDDFAERRQSPRTLNSRLEQLRVQRPDWLYTKQGDDEIYALVFDLSESGCCFMLPKDFQLTGQTVTFAIEGGENSTEAFSLPFQTIWIDEHFSHDEQKLGVEFSSVSAEQIQQLRECIRCLETDNASQLRCRLKVKEEMAFF
jgi:c-di-GMP-binding flagellar brake protein YcgR